MTKAYIIVEGPTDADFVRRILPEESLHDAKVLSAAGTSGLPSLARSVLVERRVPLAVVMDADSVDPDVVQERRQSTAELIQAAAGSTPVLVVVAVPEIEAWLFAAPDVIERTVGQSISSDFVALGKRDPKGVLQQFAKNHGAMWDTKRSIQLLDPRDIEQIRALPEVSQLIDFLGRVQRDEKAA